MNKKSLVKIINKELTILTDIVSEFSKEGEIPAFEVDMALSKTKDIYGQLLLLKKNDDSITIPVANDLDELPLSPAIAKIIVSDNRETKNHDVKSTAEVIELVEINTVKDIIDSTIQNTEPEIELAEIEPNSIQPIQEIIAPVIDSEPVLTDTFHETIVPEEPILILPEDSMEVAAYSSESLNEITTPEPHNNEEKQLDGSMPSDLPQKEEPASDEKDSHKKSGIVADKFQKLTPSLNDTLIGIKNNKNLASALKDSPIRNLKSAIKLNDRIWFTNELFNKNKMQFEKTIDVLNQSSDLDEALAYLFTNFTWDQKQKSTISFLELVFRRFAH
ncbi:MAG: hypothetical protein WCX31_11000 [Salinivirgaceae bacterium]